MRKLFASLVFVACLTAGPAKGGPVLNFVASPPQVIYTAAQRTALGLNTWPDGNMGVVSNGPSYGFYAANGSQAVYTTGSLSAPGGSAQSVSITNPQNSYDYLAGGPVYDDAGSGRRLMFYHAEIPNPTASMFYSVIGLAISTDASKLTFHDLGPIIEANVLQSQATLAVDLEGGPFVVNNGNFYVYFHDYNTNGTQNNLAVAAASVSAVVANALANHTTAFAKYRSGSFSEPGINGQSSPLETGNPITNWMSVGYNGYLNQYLMAVSQFSGSNVNLYLTSSSDGITWGPRQLLVGGSGESFYPTLVGVDGNPQVTGKTFDVYYTSSQQGGFSRWDDAALMRLSVTVPEPSSIALALLGSAGFSVWRWRRMRSLRLQQQASVTCGESTGPRSPQRFRGRLPL